MVLSLAARLLLGAALPACLVASAASAQASGGNHERVFAPVLIMHHVKPDKPTDDQIELGLTLPPALFGQDIDYLATHGYHTISARQLVSYLRSGGKLPSKPVVLTFDDGYTDMYTQVYPVLRKHQMTATFFVVPGFFDRPRYLTWKQVIDMSRHGMDIEAHSMTHPDLTTLSPARAWQEIWGSRHVLQSRLHRPVEVFAYPYGAYNASVLNDVSKAGYWAGFTTHRGYRQARSQLLTLPRVYVTREDIPALFARLLTGGAAIPGQSTR